MAKWKSTKHTGVRYREHASRKHGATPDKYFSIRYQANGKRMEEGIGWASDKWTAGKAAEELAKLKQAARCGEGHTRLSTKRKARADAKKTKKAALAEEARRNVSYTDYVNCIYDAGGIKPSTLIREISLNKLWIIPAIGQVKIVDLDAIHIKKVLRKMSRAGKSPRSRQYAIGVIRKVINHAIRNKYYRDANPVSTLEKTDRPKISNKRDRFFSHAEATTLLSELAKRSRDVHNMALLSIHSGLRAGEIFSLDWQHVDLTNRQITLTSTKSGHSRVVSMTGDVARMFESRTKGIGSQLVFPSKRGRIHKRIPKTFERVVNELGLNAGITDRLRKAVFHTCRHTCASWLVQSGVPLYQVKEIMGHSTIAITERYAHLCPSGQRQAFMAMEAEMEKKQAQHNDKVVNIR